MSEPVSIVPTTRTKHHVFDHQGRNQHSMCYKSASICPTPNLVHSTSVEKKENNGSVECCAPVMREIGTPCPDKASVIPRAYCDICKKKRIQREIVQIFGCCGGVQVSLHQPAIDWASFGDTRHGSVNECTSIHTFSNVRA